MTALAIPRSEDLLFGIAPKPVECGFGIRIGAGEVLPEVNFTLPTISIEAGTWPEVVRHYEEMVKAILRRAVAMRVPGIVLEFELLPAMTETPEWGAEITALLKRHMATAHADRGLRSALRVTPTDIRDQGKPPAMRSGTPWEKLARSFELCAQSGADILSIESIGGKEVHDPALMYGDVAGIVFALGCLAVRDMAWLWDRISAICRAAGGVVPGGDTACGFANTAMQLAGQKMLPDTLAAVIRAMSAARSLVAFEHGAVGPSKDCAYEGPIIKAITGCPISMEGKSAACAHFSPVGNVAAAMCDLWSNESVQNVRLLSGSAPEVFTEILAYDCRLMNTAARHGRSLELRDWLTESDEMLNAQAYLLSPASTIRIAEAIAGAEDGYARVQKAGWAALGLLREAVAGERLSVNPKEKQWLDRIEKALASLPKREERLWEEMKQQYSGIFDPASYGVD